ncbi:MFS transporter [Streptomyces sp. NPDC051572]|uniref:MFS transporter n=1 Tax=unclassified Streptomyces TaxID=2593676 RepID=UPI00344FAD90
MSAADRPALTRSPASGQVSSRTPRPTAIRHERRSSGWLGVSAVMFTVAWGGNSFTPLLGLYRNTLGLGELEVDALLSAYVIGIVPSLFLATRLMGRHGVKRVLAPMPALSLIGSLLLLSGTWILPLLFLGRVVIGFALGIGMVAGGVWLKELSSPPRDPAARPGLGASRAAMSLTAGFGLGAGVVGTAAQWSPLPTVLPYILHLLLAVVAQVMVIRSPDVPAPAPEYAARPARTPRRAYVRIATVAPWIFGSLGLAYAILPQLIMDTVGSLITIYSAVLCLTSLGTGFATQRLLARLKDPAAAPSAAVGFCIFVVSTCAAVAFMDSLSPWLVLLLAALLGCGYGFMLAGCLQEAERTAPAGRLGHVISVVYALAYLGFALPTLVSWLHTTTGASHGTILSGTVVLAVVAMAAGRLATRKETRGET